MKLSRRPMLAVLPAVALAGSMLTAPVAGAQSSLPIPEDLLGSASGSLNLGSLGGDSCGTEVVTPEGAEGAGWTTPGDETPATIEEVTDHTSAGALVFGPDSEEKKGTSLYKASGKKLETILDAEGQLSSPLTFDYTSEGQAPALQIRLRDASVANWGTPNINFATIVWSPAASDGSWKKAEPKADAAEWWITRDVLDADGTEVHAQGPSNLTTLDKLVELNPNATIIEYGVQKTQENNENNVAIDNFTFECVTTDFEKEAPAAPAPTGPDFGSLALGGGLALAAALAVGGGAFAIQNGLIQLPPELAAMLPQ